MIDDSIILLVKQIAPEYSLDPALVCAVIEQESGGDTWATRFEPAFYDRYIRQMPGMPPGLTTEKVQRATSWGLMQVMGETAREAPVNYYGPLPALCDPNTGITVGCKVFAEKLKAAQDLADAGGAGNIGGEIPTFVIQGALLKWNGGADPAYPDQVLARVAQYRPVALQASDPKASSSPTSS